MKLDLLSLAILVLLLSNCKKTEEPLNPGGGGGDPQKIEMGNTPWPCYYQNMKGTHLSPYNGPSGAPQQKWYVKISESGMQSCIIGADGTIYINGQNKLFAVSPDGVLKWTFDAAMFLSSSPVIDRNGIIYISGFTTGASFETTGYVYAINATDGSQKWKFSSPEKVVGGFYSAPTIGLEGYLYIPEKASKTLYALNNKGEVAWSYKAKYALAGTPTIGSDSTIYQSAYQETDLNGGLFAIKPKGQLLWELSSGGTFTPAVLLPNDVICVAGGTKVYWLKSDKTIKSSRQLSGSSYICWTLTAGKDNIVYLNSKDMNIYIHALSDGLEKYWKEYDGIATLGDDGNMYLSSGNRILSVKSTTGEINWKYDLPASMNTGNAKAVISNDGKIYIGLSNGYLLALGN